MTGLSLCQLFPFSKTYSRRRLYTRTTRTAPVLISLAKVLCKSFLFLSNSPDGRNTFRYVHKRERERENVLLFWFAIFSSFRKTCFFFFFSLACLFFSFPSKYVRLSCFRSTWFTFWLWTPPNTDPSKACVSSYSHIFYDENFKGKVKVSTQIRLSVFYFSKRFFMSSLLPYYRPISWFIHLIKIILL